MLLVKCIFIYISISTLFPFAKSNDDSPQVTDSKIEFWTQIEPIQLHWIEHREDLSQIFSPDDWFPIEINVPDTVMNIWQGVESAWTAASDYFSMDNGQVQRNTVSLE